MSSSGIGTRIRAVRRQAGLSQRDFGARLGTSSGRISEIESGKTTPGGEFLLRLYQEFGADITYVVTGESRQRVRAITDELQRAHETAQALQAAEPAESAYDAAVDAEWPLVLELVVDVLAERGRPMPSGKKLRSIVDAVLTLIRADDYEGDEAALRQRIAAMV